MRKALIDSSTYFDMLNAPKNQQAAWAQNTLHHTLRYLDQFPRLTISAFTIVEVVDGLKRKSLDTAISQFLTTALPKFEVIYPDQEVMALGGEINATLALSGKSIGVIDCLIAATAIGSDLTLVNANTRHFPRIAAVGYPIVVENWREL